MKTGILISGNGSNLAALLEIPGRDVRVVISSTRNGTAGYGVLRARRQGVPVEIIPEDIQRAVVDRENWIFDKLVSYGISHLFLAGFMKILSPAFIHRFKDGWGGRILNIHPSLLPKYKGLNAFETALKNKETELGVTIHDVVSDVDSGVIFGQRRFTLDLPVGKGVTEFQNLWLHINEQNLLKGTLHKW